MLELRGERSPNGVEEQARDWILGTALGFASESYSADTV